MSYASADGLPVTYSQATLTNAASTETLLINTNSVQVVAGSDLYLGSLGDATQLTLAPGLVTSNTPFSVVNAGANIQVNNGSSTLIINPTEAITSGTFLDLGASSATQLILASGLVNCTAPFEVTNNSTIVSLGTQSNGISVLSSTSTILELNVAPTIGAAPVPVIAIDDALITTYAPMFPSIATYYPIQPIAGQYPVGYTNQPISGTISISLTGGIKTIGTITPPSVGVWLVTATIQSQSTTQDEVYLSLSGTNGTFYTPSVVSSPISSQLVNINTNLLSTCVFSVTSAAPNVYILATSFDNNASTIVNKYTYSITRIA